MSELNYRTPYHAMKLPGVKEPYLAFLRKSILAEIKTAHHRKALLAEIRGEKWLGIVDLGAGIFDMCVNCYAYGGGDRYHRCLTHNRDDIHDFVKMDYNTFRSIIFEEEPCTYYRF